MALMIQLVGEQYLPNVLPIRHYHPERVLLVHTTRTSNQCQRLKTFLQPETTVEILETDAYDIRSIKSQLSTVLQQILSQNPTTELLFNLTGGTKTMMLAAYQVAEQHRSDVFYLQSEGVQSKIYSYSWRGDQLGLRLQEQLPKYVSLSDVLNLHFGQKNWEEKNPERDPGKKQFGGMFEWAIAQTLRDHGYEVMCEVKNSAMDIDVMIGHQNQVGIIEAKAFEQNGKDPNLESVGQLSKVGRHLGTFTKQFFVLNKMPSDTQKSILDALRVTYIPLLHYNQGIAALTPEDKETLLEAVDVKMKAR